MINVAALGLIAALSIQPTQSLAAKKSWDAWVQEVRQEAIHQGIKPRLFDTIFKDVKPRQKVLRLDRRQPEKRLTFLEYRKSRIDGYRIRLGVKEYNKHKVLLNNVGREYGVSPCFIVALWGIESSYGHYMGNHPVIESLATLAYDHRRSAFFRKELFHALHILNDGHVSLKNFKGEWAGGTGQPQFLPSSWHNYAVDQNGDGYKDIWNHYGDIFASIANYLTAHGWHPGEPWGIPVNAPSSIDPSLISLKKTKKLSQWKTIGIQPITGHPWPQQNLQASLIEPDGGPAFLVFNNFKVLMRWNRSTFYAASVGYMANQLCQKIA